MIWSGRGSHIGAGSIVHAGGGIDGEVMEVGTVTRERARGIDTGMGTATVAAASTLINICVSTENKINHFGRVGALF